MKPEIERDCRINNTHKHLKKELLALFQKFGYLTDSRDYEVRIKTTAGNIAWINVNSTEIIK